MRKYKSTQDTLTHTYRHTHTNTVLSLRNHGNHKIRTCNAKIQIQTRQQRCSCDEKAAKGRLCVPQTSSLGGDKEKAERGSGRGGKASPKWLCTTGCRPMAARGRQKRKTTTGRPSERGVVDEQIEQRKREREREREMEQERKREWGRDSEGPRGGESCICTARK